MPDPTRRHTIRDRSLRPGIVVSPDLAHSYIPLQPEPLALSAVTVEIFPRQDRRVDEEDINPRNVRCAGPRRDPLLTYPAHDWANGYIGFRWDTALHALPPGRYEAIIYVRQTPVHVFEIIVPAGPSVGRVAENKTIDQI